MQISRKQVLVLSLLLIVFSFSLNARAQQGSLYKDGVYEGYSMEGPRKVGVAVIVEDGKITQARPISGLHNWRRKAALRVCSEVVSKQSADISTQSGATAMHQAVISAAQDALNKAKK